MIIDKIIKTQRSWTMIDKYKIGNQISFLRREKGLTGEKLAEQLGVSPQAVSKWENGVSLR